MADVLVLGAGFGGLNVCLRLANTGHDVKLIDREGHHEYTPGLIDLYRERHTPDDLRVNLNRLLEPLDVEFQREVVKAIHPDAQKVSTNAGSHSYDYIVIGLGSDCMNYGMDVSSAYEPYTLTETKDVAEAIEDAEKITVVGAGYVGVEVAGELAEKDRQVTVVDGATRPMARANEKASKITLNYFNEKGIDFRGGNNAKRVEETKIVLENGKSIGHDECLWAAGIQASELVQDYLGAGRSGLEVDDHLRWTKYPEVFGIGDCADTGGKKTAHNAMRQAKVVAKNVGRQKKDMVSYSPEEYPLMVSMGETAMMNYGDIAIRNPLFRRAKDMVMKGYIKSLKARQFRGRIL